MPCYHPIRAFRSLEGRDKITGKWPLVFRPDDGYQDLPVEIPCGQCIGCRLERSRQWALRCVAESKMYDDNCFITLTFNDDHLRPDMSLDKRDFVLFMKRLRKRFGDGIRFFHCGEYGEKFGRPHHHAILFNFNFIDRQLYTIEGGVRLDTSVTLDDLWKKGYCTVGDVTFESAAYVARYIVKKVTGEAAEDYYRGREPPYITMSRRPGIGRGFIEKYMEDSYPHDFLVLRDGIKCRPPKYFDEVYDKFDKEGENNDCLEKLKYSRKKEGLKHKENNTLNRLRVREIVQERRAEKLVRPYE